MVGLPNNAKSRDESWQFVTYLTGPEAQTRASEELRRMPTHRKAAEAAKSKSGDPKYNFAIDQLPVSKTEPVIPEWSLAWDEHVTAEQDALFGRKSPKEALSEATKKVQEAIDKRLQG